MNYSELPPPPALAAVVRCFWFLRSDQVDATPQPVVADGRLEIVLHAAEPFARVSEGRHEVQADALLAGQLTAPLYLQQRGAADVVGIRFRTASASYLIRHPLHELNNQVVSLGAIDWRLRDALLLALQQSSEPIRRRDLLSGVLLRHLGSAVSADFADSTDSPIASAVRALDDTGVSALGMLARRFGMSTRTLERRVLAATGLTPRALRQTLRFRRAFRALQEAGPGEMTMVALQAGYFDQAHCIREFRRFTGKAPSAFFAEDPTLASALVASVQSNDQTA